MFKRFIVELFAPLKKVEWRVYLFITLAVLGIYILGAGAIYLIYTYEWAQYVLAFFMGLYIGGVVDKYISAAWKRAKNVS